MLYGTPLPARKVLRRLLIYKVQKDWKRWQAILAARPGTLQQYEDLIKNDIAPEPNIFLTRFGPAFYKALSEDIQSFLQDKGIQEASKMPTHSWLQEFTGRQQKQRGKHKKPNYLETLCQYVGFDGYTHFEHIYRLYQRLTQTTRAFRIILQNDSQFYQQVDDMLALYEHRVKSLLPEKEAQQLQSLQIIPATGASLTNPPLEEWTVQKLFAEAALQKAPLEWLHEVIYVQQASFQSIEQAPSKTQNISWKWLSLGGVAVVLTIFFILYIIPDRTRVLTQAEMDQISLKVLDIEQAKEGNATVQIAYDARKLGNDQAIEKLGLRLQGNYPQYTRKLTKAQDTLLMVYEVPGKYYIHIRQKQVYKAAHLHLPSQDWFAIATSEGANGPESAWHSKVIPKAQATQNQQLIFPQYFMPQYARRYFYTRYRYAKPLNIPINDFSIEIKAKIHTDSLLNATCFESALGLSSDQNKRLIMKILNQGCSRWGVIHFGDRQDHFNNANTQGQLLQKLKAFVQPLAKMKAWHTLKMQVKNRVVHYYFNGEKLHSQPAPRLQGNIDCIETIYKGLGAIDYVKIWDGTDNLAYQEHFYRENHKKNQVKNRRSSQ